MTAPSSLITAPAQQQRARRTMRAVCVGAGCCNTVAPVCNTQALPHALASSSTARNGVGARQAVHVTVCAACSADVRAEPNQPRPCCSTRRSGLGHDAGRLMGVRGERAWRSIPHVWAHTWRSVMSKDWLTGQQI